MYRSCWRTRSPALGANTRKQRNHGGSVIFSIMFDSGGMLTHTLLFQPKVVVAGNLITGQNPASAHPIGEAILQALQK